MKKYILLSLLCLAILHLNANPYIEKSDQDSIVVLGKVRTLNLDMGKLDKHLQEVEKNLASIDFSGLEKSLNSQMEGLEKNMKDLQKLENLNSNFVENFNQFGNNSNVIFDKKEKQQDKTPTRVEKKSFNNISEVEFIHQYGNIVVRQSNSNQIDIEIQYFDTQKQTASCEITTKNKLLSISTNNTGKSNTRAKINYIISIPKSVALNINSRYGDVKMDKYEGILNASLSYSALSAQSIIAPADITVRYGDIKIDNAQDVKINASYSNIRIDKANKLELSGNYNDYVLNEAEAVSVINNSSYTDYKLGTIGSLNAKILYGDVIIDNLTKSLTVATNYGDISVRSVSSKLEKFNVTANYADISVSLPDNISLNFDFSVNYGDVIISKKYNTKYTESAQKNVSVVKKGQIGSGTPTGNIVVRNNYADIRIK